MTAPKCHWCGYNRKPSKWEQKHYAAGWQRLCVACAQRRLNNPLNGLLPMRKVDTSRKTAAEGTIW